MNKTHSFNSSSNQGELFQKSPCDHLYPYWRKSLKGWIKDVWDYRHYRDCTGWSMACQGFLFARFLFMNGQLSKIQFKRFFRLKRRVDRWEKKGRK